MKPKFDRKKYAREYMREYRQRPEVKEKICKYVREYRQRPEGKAVFARSAAKTTMTLHKYIGVVPRCPKCGERGTMKKCWRKGINTGNETRGIYIINHFTFKQTPRKWIRDCCMPAGWEPQ